MNSGSISNTRLTPWRPIIDCISFRQPSNDSDNVGVKPNEMVNFQENMISGLRKTIDLWLISMPIEKLSSKISVNFPIHSVPPLCELNPSIRDSDDHNSRSWAWHIQAVHLPDYLSKINPSIQRNSRGDVQLTLYPTRNKTSSQHHMKSLYPLPMPTRHRAESASTVWMKFAINNRQKILHVRELTLHATRHHTVEISRASAAVRGF